VILLKTRHARRAGRGASLEVHGQPSDPLLQYLTRATEGIPLTIYPTHWGGFTRIGSEKATA
jgi:hypothetical protein